MHPSNPVVQLCVEITRAEYEGRINVARALADQAWEAAQDDADACMAAHYVARYQESPQEALRWNLEALNRAHTANAERVKDFYPSLYLNLGHSYERMGDPAEAQKYYHLAAQLGLVHQTGTQKFLKNSLPGDG
jgi:tetratricopeptide (TPR) repeat protein